MVSNSKSQIFRFTIRTTGLFLSGSTTSGYNPANLILQYRIGNNDWTTFKKGQSQVTLSGSNVILRNLDPEWNGAADTIRTKSFPGVPGKGGGDLNVAVLVPNITSVAGSLEYRVVAKSCQDCWEFFINSVESRDRALSEPVEGASSCAVVATGSLYENN